VPQVLLPEVVVHAADPELNYVVGFAAAVAADAVVATTLFDTSACWFFCCCFAATTAVAISVD